MQLHAIGPWRHAIMAAKSEPAAGITRPIQPGPPAHNGFLPVGTDDPAARHRFAVDGHSTASDACNASVPAKVRTHFPRPVYEQLVQHVAPDAAAHAGGKTRLHRIPARTETDAA